MEIITNLFLAFFGMVWEIFWGLALGFILSSIIRAFVPTETISNSIGKTSVKSLSISTFFGAISSSCSYAAASMSRTLMTKGASLPNSIAFLISSTNLVFEIFIIILSLLGWAFFIGELIGGLFFIAFTAILIAKFFPKKVIKQAQEHIEESENNSHTMQMDHSKMEHSKMEHSKMKHSEMEHSMMYKKPGIKDKIITASTHFVMDVNMVGKDIFIGVLISAFLMVLIPKEFWESLFLKDNAEFPQFAILLWNAVIGALIAVLSFVCSVGNIVLAAVLWFGGISFGGVIAFVLSDLITLPMLQVYRKYYGWKPMLFIFLFLFVGIVATALFLDYSFDFLGWIPESPTEALQLHKNPFELNFNSIMNFIFIPIAFIYYFVGKKHSKGMSMNH